MSDKYHIDHSGVRSNGTRRPRIKWRGLVAPVTVGLALSLLSGCASWNRHHITVGAVPDDYRTNHPIVLSEQEEVFDVPVARGDRKLNTAQAGPVEGFIQSYVRNGSGTIRIIMPMGSPNEDAASRIGGQIGHLMKKQGIRPSKIAFNNYSVTSPGAAAPIRLTYIAISASTGQCGKWPENLFENGENRHYANFGCAYQNNLAASVANPSDLLGPRDTTPIDAQNRGAVIDTYQNPEPEFKPSVKY